MTKRFFRLLVVGLALGVVAPVFADDTAKPEAAAPAAAEGDKQGCMADGSCCGAGACAAAGKAAEGEQAPAGGHADCPCKRKRAQQAAEQQK